MKIVIDDVEYMTLEEVQEMLSTNKTSVYEKMRYNCFPKPLKLKARSLWKRSEIEAYAANSGAGAAPANPPANPPRIRAEWPEFK